MKFVQFGLGRWGMNHNRILKEMNHSVLVLEIDSFPRGLSYLDIPSNMDGVIITSSSVNHYVLLRECLDRQVPVLCEKPICLKPWQMDELYALWERRDHPIFMAGHQVNFLPELVSDVRYMMALRSGAIAREEGATLSLMVHDIAVAQKVTRAKKFSVVEKHGDLHNMKVSLEADNNACVDLLSQSYSPIRVRHTVLVRENGAIINLKPDNWDRLDLLKMEIAAFVRSAQLMEQPVQNGMKDTKIVMDTIFDIL